MPDDRFILDHQTTAETLKEMVPPVLMAFGAISLLRTSKLLSLVALGAYLYNVAAKSEAERKAGGRNVATRRAVGRSIDTEMEDSFPASDPPSFSGSTAGAP
jgi:hypothetical protein